ncbi:sporulation related domain protein [Ferrovum sp. JA12]|uniref:SPOR domain-containing protein n=1 Tax=Ferrovum sp. JA12 TaxID=1356299 RepID=UPI00070315B8|nr:SPOR domain-containing protein [Ferrovum sp. JA12]KRH78923.1 sporulation related domain protein [Ferrovum sp. JA12]
MAKPQEWEKLDLYRVSARRRAIGAALIMAFVVVLLPMLLNHSKTPKLSPDLGAAMPSHSPIHGAPSTAPSPLVNTHEQSLAVSSLDRVTPASTRVTPMNINHPSLLPPSLPSSLSSVSTEGSVIASPSSQGAAMPNQVASITQASAPLVQKNTTAAEKKIVKDSADTPLLPEQPKQPQALKESGSSSVLKSSSLRSSVQPVVNGTHKILQLGLFSEENRAKNLIKELKGHGGRAKIDKVTLNHKVRYRVYVGPFSSNDKIHRTKKQLLEAGFPSLIKELH